MDTNCKNCGAACCKGVVVQINNCTGDDRKWAETRGMIIGNKWHIRSVCKWLQGGRCTIYDDRPEACKVFKVGGEDCRAAQEAFK